MKKLAALLVVVSMLMVGCGKDTSKPKTGTTGGTGSTTATGGTTATK